MPIRPENQALYPGGSIRSPEWLEIRARIQKRAGNCCEACGVANGAIGGRLRDGVFLPRQPYGEKLLRLEWPQPGDTWWCSDGQRQEKLRIIRIVCTVAHLDHDPTHNDDENLSFLCQRCHNRHDQSHRKASAAAARRAGRAVGDMFEP